MSMDTLDNWRGWDWVGSGPLCVWTVALSILMPLSPYCLSRHHGRYRDRWEDDWELNPRAPSEHDEHDEK